MLNVENITKSNKTMQAPKGEFKSNGASILFPKMVFHHIRLVAVVAV